MTSSWIFILQVHECREAITCSLKYHQKSSFADVTWVKSAIRIVPKILYYTRLSHDFKFWKFPVQWSIRRSEQHVLRCDKQLLHTFGKFIQYHWAPESLSILKSNDCYAFGICYMNFVNTSFQTSVHLKEYINIARGLLFWGNYLCLILHPLINRNCLSFRQLL